MRVLPRTLDAVGEVLDFTDAFSAKVELGEGAAFNARIVMEELFTNLLRHDKGGEDAITVALGFDGTRFVMTLEHEGVERPSVPPPDPVDVHAPLDARTPGGLGLHLVRSIVDTLEYDYLDGRLTVTATMNLE